MLFFLDKNDRASLKPVPGTTLARHGWTEKQLEDLVAQHIDHVVRESQLLVIHQERQYQEEPDIMALDREGRLHLFELKRWGADAENLLQVLRYGQRFGQHEYQALNYLFRRYARRGGQEDGPADLAEAHRAYFDLDAPLPSGRFNHDQVFVVMVNGLDRATRGAMAYWSAKGLPIRPLVYRVYATQGGDLLFEIEPYGTEPDTTDADDAATGLAVVNTNATYMADAWQDMLKKSKAAAYYDRKTAVDGISLGDPVALFHRGVGVIAIGKAATPFGRTAVGTDADEEHYVIVDFDFKVDPVATPHLAVTAREINEHLRASHRFRQTVYTLPAAASDFIRGRFEAKGVKRTRR